VNAARTLAGLAIVMLAASCAAVLAVEDVDYGPSDAASEDAPIGDAGDAAVHDGNDDSSDRCATVDASAYRGVFIGLDAAPQICDDSGSPSKLDSDPNNCGWCGRSCGPPGARCLGGHCVVEPVAAAPPSTPNLRVFAHDGANVYWIAVDYGETSHVWSGLPTGGVSSEILRGDTGVVFGDGRLRDDQFFFVTNYDVRRYAHDDGGATILATHERASLRSSGST
jgi:hypothetical protein